MKEDVEKLINWCNEHSKNERANLISKKTTFEKYGVEHALQLNEIQNKAKETTMKHYGVEHPAQNEKYKKFGKNLMLKCMVLKIQVKHK